MAPSIVGSAALLACAITSVASSALPLPAEHLRPRVSWADTGVSDVVRRQNSYPSGCSHGSSSRGCWNGDFNIDTDMDQHWPTTGKTVKYHFDITNTTLAPDGFSRPMLVINGQYPGPAIVADWGDMIEVSVTNNLERNGTGLHWHGFRQMGSNEMDGANGITECPIAPGGTRTYRFKATQYGTTWYHSHYSVQYGDGLAGPIVIKGPATADYDIDLGALPITDWFHATTFTINAQALHANGPPTADNILINGSMTSGSGGQYAVTTLTPGKTHLLRLINIGINNHFHVGIDGHPFTVVAADFVPIVPYKATSLSIAVGQRYDVIIKADQKVDNYWLRVGTGGSGRCDGPNANVANTRSIIRYDGAPKANPTNSSAAVQLPPGCDDETNIVPYVKTTVPSKVPEEMKVAFTNTAGSGNLVQWLVNGSPMRIDLEQPTLLSVKQGNSTFAPNHQVFKVGTKNQWQYWVIQMDNATFSPPLPHPIHLHGHDFYVLDSQANAQWSGDLSRLKTDNPPRRDTATLPAAGYLVLAFESDNPGAWLMHCHIPFHVAAGLGVQFLERADEIVGSNGGFGDMESGCAAWKGWREKNYPGGILIEGDNGL